MVVKFTKYDFLDAICLSPKVIIRKGDEIPFVEMANVATGNRKEPMAIEMRKFSGGTKFEKGDTVVASIEPCLQHGKSFYFTEHDRGAGSTEYLVFRGIEDITTNEFVHYFMMSYEIRAAMIRSMKGATGRQRVDPEVFTGMKIELPDIPTQKKIAAVLSDYDAAIANCRKQIALLEEAAMRLYREWFGDGKGEKTRLGGIANIIMGQSPSSDSYNYDHEGLPFHQGVTGFGVRFPVNEMWCRAGTRFANAGDILFSVRAPVGRINVSKEKIVIGRGLSAICEKRGFQCWLLYALKSYFTKENMIGSGCIFASTTKNELFDVKLPYPGGALIQKFNAIVQPIDDTLVGLDNQIRSLTEARDRLLPKLMKGEIEV